MKPESRNKLGRLAIGSLVSVAMLIVQPWALADSGASVQPAGRYDTSYSIISPVYAHHGMVVTAQHIASQVGADILRKGGNAVDAAVAVGFTLAVVLPQAGNLAGGGFMLIHDVKTGKQTALDFREMAPAHASRDMYIDASGNVVHGRSTATHLAVGVPGTVAGMEHALRQFGTMKLADVIAPALKLARDGFVVDRELAASLYEARYELGRWPATREIFFKGDRPLQEGERLTQRDLANTLSLIAAQGSDAFYRGAIARKLVAEMTAHDGLISLDDLKNYHVIERVPVSGDYHGYHVVSMPPPSSGGTHIIEMLNILSRYPLRDWKAGSAQTIQAEAETMKLAYADRAEYLGDPDFVKVPVKGLTSLAYADELASHIDLQHATPSAAIKPGKPIPYESNQTTHYSVADQFGNVVSTTYTLNLNFGTGIVAKGTGMLLNNQMDDFSAKPGVPNSFGLVGGEANAIAPMKRPLSSMSPTIVFKDGKAWMVVGASGGSRIISAVLQTIINAIDFDMNAAEAAVAPRIHHQWQPDQLRVERSLSPDTQKALSAMGQNVSVQEAMARVQTLMINADGFSGFADPRSPDGSAVGY